MDVEVIGLTSRQKVSRTIYYVAARRDVNGNPRRGWQVDYHDGISLVRTVFVDEGYEGAEAFRRAFPQFGRDVDPLHAYGYQKITAAEYRRLLTLHVDGGQAPLVPSEAQD